MYCDPGGACRRCAALEECIPLWCFVPFSVLLFGSCHCLDFWLLATLGIFLKLSISWVFLSSVSQGFLGALHPGAFCQPSILGFFREVSSLRLCWSSSPYWCFGGLYSFCMEYYNTRYFWCFFFLFGFFGSCLPCCFFGVVTICLFGFFWQISTPDLYWSPPSPGCF